MSNKTKIQVGPAELAWTVVAGQGLQNYNKDGFNLYRNRYCRWRLGSNDCKSIQGVDCGD